MRGGACLRVHACVSTCVCMRVCRALRATRMLQALKTHCTCYIVRCNTLALASHTRCTPMLHTQDLACTDLLLRHTMQRWYRHVMVSMPLQSPQAKTNSPCCMYARTEPMVYTNTSENIKPEMLGRLRTCGEAVYSEYCTTQYYYCDLPVPFERSFLSKIKCFVISRCKPLGLRH